MRLLLGPSFGSPIPRRLLAISAPSLQDFSFAHVTSGATASGPADVAKPQSVPAIHPRSVSHSSDGLANPIGDNFGCSTKLVVVSITPGIRIISWGSGFDFIARYSCWCLGFANSMLAAA
jgi:hypothetical protein